MQRFSQLYAELDRTSETDAKVAAMVDYFRNTPAEDAAWAVFLTTGQRLKRLVSSKVLREWASSTTGYPEWLLAEAHTAVGDSDETVSLLVDRGLVEPVGAADLHCWIEERILPLRGQPAESREALVADWWRNLPRAEIFLLNKLLTGGFRASASKLLVVRALAELADLPRPVISHRLTGRWQPTADWYRRLLDPHTADDDRSQPYPFFRASPLEQEPQGLGAIDRWLVEWKWDGMRAQLIRRGGETFLWTCGEEPVIDKYPELLAMAEKLPDGIVLDGEILAWNDDGIMASSVLQRRIGREMIGRKILEEAPVRFLAFDLLEEEGEDLRSLPLDERRKRLETIVGVAGKPLMTSALIRARHWGQLTAVREECRARGVDGLMLKRKASAYGTGRRHGDWWTWKNDALKLDAVLIYANAGSGGRANLFTDYTFGVWNGEELVPIAKACSGLSDEEIRVLDRWIRQNTIKRQGPFREVTPHHVFELGFEGLSLSKRRKSGLALRSPCIVRWRSDKLPKDADRLEQVKALLAG